MSQASLVLLLGSAIACGACKKKAPVPQSTQAPRELAPAPSRRSPVQLDVAVAKVPTRSALPKPLTGGKRVRLDKLGVPAVDITVPPDFKLRMEESESPQAIFVAPEYWELIVEEPEAGDFTLRREKAMVLRGDSRAKFIHEQEDAGGFMLVDQDSIDGPSKYSARITRPGLKVNCGAYGLDRLVDAEKAASICLTLGPSQSRNGH